MPTTTATTGSPPTAGPGELTVRQRVSHPRPSLAACVQERLCQLHDRGVRTVTLDDFERTAKRAGRPLSWIGDHLLVLEGVGILRPVALAGSTTRAWTVSSASEYLR